MIHPTLMEELQTRDSALECFSKFQLKLLGLREYIPKSHFLLAR